MGRYIQMHICVYIDVGLRVDVSFLAWKEEKVSARCLESSYGVWNLPGGNRFRD